VLFRSVKHVAYPVLGLRLVIRPDAAASGLTPQRAVAEILASVPVVGG